MKGIIVSLGFLLFILMAIASVKPSMADDVWEDLTHGIRDAALYAVACDASNSDIVYLGSSKSIYKTIDGGRSWEEIFTVGGTQTAVNFITVDPESPGVIYAALQNGLYKTADNGEHWVKLFSGFSELERNTRSIAIDTEDSNKIYLGTCGGLFWTDDGGKTWQRSSGELSDSTVRSIAICSIEPHILYAATSEGVFKTKNIEMGWERIFITSEEVVEELEVEDSDVDEAMSNPEVVNWIELDPSNPKIVYLGTEDGAFSSVDGGSSWKKMPEEGLLSDEIRCILISRRDPNLLYSATRKGVFRFSKELNGWQELYAGITARDIRSLAFDKGGNWLWAATDKGAFKISSGENPLQAQPKEMTPEAILTHFAHEPTVQEIQLAAIRYAEVIDPKRIEKLRKGARAKALLPDLDLDYDKGSVWHKDSEYWVGPTDWSVGLSWDLGDLIWSEQQRLIDSQVRLMVKLRDDILDEVTRLYFERRRLQVELLLTPPEDIKTKLEKELRLQELTADIDGLTGGYLSRRLRLRKG